MDSYKDKLAKLEPYRAGEQINGDDVIKLNANENPYPPSLEVRKALSNFSYENLNKYPPTGINPLEETIAEKYGMSPKNVLSGNSSDEVLAMCFKAFFNSEKPILFPDITYSFYPVWCNFYSIPYKEIPLTCDFKINIEDYNIKESGGVIIPNPNAPTGIEVDLDSVEKLLKDNVASVVIIDEAYSDFGEISAVDLIKSYDNLVVTKTMSKSGSLAGLRVGYALGNEYLIKVLTQTMHSFNAYPLSLLSMQLAQAALNDEAYLKGTVNKIIKTRWNTVEALAKLGFELTDSRTNFLFITHPKIEAKQLYSYLYEKRILVRYFSHERLKDHLRVTVGTDEEMKKLLNEIIHFMEDGNVI